MSRWAAGLTQKIWIRRRRGDRFHIEDLRDGTYQVTDHDIPTPMIVTRTRVEDAVRRERDGHRWQDVLTDELWVEARRGSPV